MIKRILQQAGQLAKAALQGTMQWSGVAALYLCSSAFLAMLLLAAILTYTGYIDKIKWYRALAILQGVELAEIQKAEQDRAAEVSYENVLRQRAERFRTEEYDRDVTQQVIALPPPPEPPKPEPPPPEPSDAEKISAYVKRVKDDLAKARTAGLDEQTRLIENMDPEQAKEVIRRLWKEGARQRVLTMLLAMTDKRRGEILYTMQQDNDAELKDLCDILQNIGDGEPMASTIKNASKE